MCIFDLTKFSNMKTYERIIRDRSGKDTGVRENERGAMYINHEVFFKDERTIRVVDALRNSDIVKKIRLRRDNK